VMGEWAYSAEGDKPDDPNLSGKMALADPLGPRVTLVHGFLEIPVLKGIITDTHFAKRDRMGRLAAFLARIFKDEQNRPIRGLGVEEQTAVLLELDGRAQVMGHGGVYLLTLIGRVMGLRAGEPLNGGMFEVRKFVPAGVLDLSRPENGGARYGVAVKKGALVRTDRAGSVY